MQIKCVPSLTVNFSLLSFLLANDDDEEEDEQDGECQEQITNIRRYVLYRAHKKPKAFPLMIYCHIFIAKKW